MAQQQFVVVGVSVVPLGRLPASPVANRSGVVETVNRHAKGRATHLLEALGQRQGQGGLAAGGDAGDRHPQYLRRRPIGTVDEDARQLVDNFNRGHGHCSLNKLTSRV